EPAHLLAAEVLLFSARAALVTARASLTAWTSSSLFCHSLDLRSRSITVAALCCLRRALKRAPRSFAALYCLLRRYLSNRRDAPRRGSRSCGWGFGRRGRLASGPFLPLLLQLFHPLQLFIGADGEKLDNRVADAQAPLELFDGLSRLLGGKLEQHVIAFALFSHAIRQ